MNRKKGNKLRKSIIITLVAGVVLSQSLPLARAAELSAEEETAIVPGGAGGQTTGDDTGSEGTTQSGSSGQPTSGDTGQTGSTAGSEGTSDTSGDQGTSDASGESTASNDMETGDADKDAKADDSTQTDEEKQAADDNAEAAQAEQPAEDAAVEATVPLTDDDSVKETEDLHEDDTEVIPEGDLVPAPVINNSFRFWTVAKDYAYASEDLPVMEEKKESSVMIGELKKDALCYRIKDEGDWYYMNNGEAERAFFSGGSWYAGAGAGVFTSDGHDPRSSTNGDIGFRSAFVKLPSA